jgi:tetratricopeptide (TPR) repeat protein
MHIPLPGDLMKDLSQYNKLIEMEPNFRRGFEGRGMIYLAMGENEKAVKDFEQYHKLVGNPLKGLSSLGHAYAAAGYKDKALEVEKKLKLREEKEPGTLLYMDYAFLYSGMKQFDLAFEYLNKTYEQRMGIACLWYDLLRSLSNAERIKIRLTI